MNGCSTNCSNGNARKNVIEAISNHIKDVLVSSDCLYVFCVCAACMPPSYWNIRTEENARISFYVLSGMFVLTFPLGVTCLPHSHNLSP